MHRYLKDQNAESWLEGHPVTNPILKWDTRAWGEIPADFDRKSR
jgi:ribonuclease HI